VIITDDHLKLSHHGRSRHRLSSNPLEKAFADQWEVENEHSNDQECTLAWLLYSDGADRPNGGLAQEDCTKAATIIQWLGSPVGRGFLEEALAREGLTISYARKARS
jgi:hypothetical protein